MWKRNGKNSSLSDSRREQHDTWEIALAKWGSKAAAPKWLEQAGGRVSLAEQAGGRRLIRAKSFYIVERAKSGVKKNMQLKHLACVLAKDPLILMEAYCLCCNSLVLDVRLVRTKANLYIPSDLCFRSLGYRTHIFIPCGFNPGQEWMFTRIKWHSWFHLFLARMQNRPGINPVVPNEALAGPGVAMFRNKCTDLACVDIINFLKR